MKIMGLLYCMWVMVQLHYLGVKFWGLKQVRNTGMMGWIVCQQLGCGLALFM